MTPCPPCQPAIDDGSLSSVPERKRVVGIYDQGTPGPTTIFVTAMHGNEPMGLKAARRVLDELTADQPPFRGRMIAVIGNCQALSIETRLVDTDLNREFPYEVRLDHGGPCLIDDADPFAVETRERDELLRTLRELVKDADDGTEVVIIDLHTFSSDGSPFVLFSDTLRNRAFADCWPLPQILGLAERVPGTLTDYLTAAGCVSAIIETGRHDKEISGERHAAVIRLALERAGHFANPDTEQLNADRALLRSAVKGLPRTLDVKHRHPVCGEDQFVMHDGYHNFLPVTAREHVADDASGKVYATRQGRILLPLYQPQGDDGFFVARVIGHFWLTLSSWLRRIGTPRLAPLLPGVRRRDHLHETLEIDTKVARWFVMDFFHLLGYRRLKRDADHVVVARRPHDTVAPARVKI